MRFDRDVTEYKLPAILFYEIFLYI